LTMNSPMVIMFRIFVPLRSHRLALKTFAGVDKKNADHRRP